MNILSMKKELLVFILSTLCTISVFTQSKEEKKLIIETIIENDRKLEDFFQKGRADSIAGMFSQNSHLIAEYQNLVEKREEIEKHFNKLFKSGKAYSTFKLEAEEHKVYDDLVLEIGENMVKYTMDDESKTHSEKLNYILIWKKSKSGKYQIRAAMWNLTEDPCK